MQQFSLQVKEGDFVSLIGPSGSGKSTLFYLIGGVYRPTEGDIQLEGQSIVGKRGQIGYMPQQASLLPWRTVAENIRLGAELSSGKSTVDVHTLLEKANLTGLEQKYPHQLSGGMQQRVAFLRTLMGTQSLLCLDEPFAALDALTRSEMQYWLWEILQREKRTVLFITHSIEEALLLSNRVIVLGKKPMNILDEIRIPFAQHVWEDKRHDPLLLNMRKEIEQILQARV